MGTSKGFGVIGAMLVIAFLVAVGGGMIYYTQFYKSATLSVIDKTRQAFSTVNTAELVEKSLSQIVKRESLSAVRDFGVSNSVRWPDAGIEDVRKELEKEIKNRLDKLDKIKLGDATVKFDEAVVAVKRTEDGFEIYVSKPFTVSRSKDIQSFTYRDYGIVKEKVRTGFFDVSSAALDFFWDYDYASIINNKLAGLKTSATVSRSCGSCSYSCYSCPISVADVLRKTDYSEIENRVREAIETIDRSLKGRYPYLKYSPELYAVSISKSYSIKSDTGESEETYTKECSRTHCIEWDPVTGECTNYETDTWTTTICHNQRSIDFKFTVEAKIRLRLTDPYSPVPAAVSERYLPVRVDATFRDWGKIPGELGSGEGKFPVWIDDDGNIYIPGRDLPVPGSGFIFLGRDPENPERYLLWENGVSLSQVKSKNYNFCTDSGFCTNIPETLSKVRAPLKAFVLNTDFTYRGTVG
ncbi:MAG: hypothetical protein GXO63_03440 [Candidatus Micrarchaeota archaeon]|nr:hypothetical protein [Candidatus Micrarchaeota archaeon]